MQTSEAIECILDAARDSKLPEGMDEEEVRRIVLDVLEDTRENIPVTTKERALLAAGYLNRSYDGWAGALDRHCADAFEEPEKMLRGRKHWVALLRFFDDESYQELEGYLERLGSEERSDYVWERVFALLRSQEESWRFYPYPLAFLPKFKNGPPESYSLFVADLEQRFRTASVLSSYINAGIEGWCSDIAKGELPAEALSPFMEALAVSGKDSPLPAGRFSELYRSVDTSGRTGLLLLLRKYLDRLETTARFADTVRSLLPAFIGIDDKDLSLYERCFHLTVRLIAAEEDAPRLFIEGLDFLLHGIPEREQTPELMHDAVDSIGSHLLRLAYSVGVSEKDLAQSAELLQTDSEYMKHLGASLLLTGARKGYNLAGAVTFARCAFEENPDTSNALAEGKDIEPSELEFSTNLPSPKAFGLEPDEDDAFMNLRNLTGLLEMCKPPSTALRLKLFLDLQEEQPEVPRSFAVFPPAAESTRVAGPMSLPEAEALLAACAKDPEQAGDLLHRKADELSARYREELTARRRSMVVSVFEGGDEQAPSRYAAAFESIAADGFDWPSPPDISFPEDSFDVLAWYRPVSGLAPGKAGYCGVYFHLPRILDYAGRYDLPLESLIRLTAVHELYHAFTERRMRMHPKGREAYLHNHAGEQPPWCRLEEAAANRASSEWGKEHLDADVFGRFRLTLLREYDGAGTGGLPGYGEYTLLDKEAPAWVPLMLEEGVGHPQPPEYGNDKKLLSLKRQEEHTTSRYVWEGMLKGMDLDDVGWFVSL